MKVQRLFAAGCVLAVLFVQNSVGAAAATDQSVVDGVTLQCTNGQITNVSKQLLANNFSFFESYFKVAATGRFKPADRIIVNGTVEEMQYLLSFVSGKNLFLTDKDFSALSVLSLANFLGLADQQMKQLKVQWGQKMKQELYSKPAYEKFLKGDLMPLRAACEVSDENKPSNYFSAVYDSPLKAPISSSRVQMIMQPNRKIIVASLQEFSDPELLRIIRYNNDLRLDQSFGESGVINHSTQEIKDFALKVWELDRTNPGDRMIKTLFLQLLPRKEGGFFECWTLSAHTNPKSVGWNGQDIEWQTNAGSLFLARAFDERGLPDKNFGEEGYAFINLGSHPLNYLTFNPCLIKDDGSLFITGNGLLFGGREKLFGAELSAQGVPKKFGSDQKEIKVLGDPKFFVQIVQQPNGTIVGLSSDWQLTAFSPEGDDDPSFEVGNAPEKGQFFYESFLTLRPETGDMVIAGLKGSGSYYNPRDPLQVAVAHCSSNGKCGFKSPILSDSTPPYDVFIQDIRPKIAINKAGTVIALLNKGNLLSFYTIDGEELSKKISMDEFVSSMAFDPMDDSLVLCFNSTLLRKIKYFALKEQNALRAFSDEAQYLYYALKSRVEQAGELLEELELTNELADMFEDFPPVLQDRILSPGKTVTRKLDSSAAAAGGGPDNNDEEDFDFGVLQYVPVAALPPLQIDDATDFDFGD